MPHFATMHQEGKRTLIVIGMHRSGTSATTGALQYLGVQLGQRLYSGHPDINAKGYFEHSDIADTNDEALFALGSSWDDVLIKDNEWWNSSELDLYAKKIQAYIRRDFSKSPLWAVKDPRVCRLLPWWLKILSNEHINPYFLFVVRSPEAVFQSLHRRDGFSKEKAYLLWALHYLEAERDSRGYPRAFLSFDHFLRDPVNQFQRVETALGISFPIPVSQATKNLETFLSSDLRHHSDKDEYEIGNNPIIALSRQLYAELQLASEHGEAGLNTKAMDKLWNEMEAFQHLQQSGPLAEHARLISKNRGQLELALIRLMRSWSWYTGKPIRFLERLLNRDV